MASFRCPACNCGVHYPRRLFFFVMLTASTLILMIIFLLTVTGPAIHSAEQYWHSSTCTFSCDNCLDVYFTVSPDDFSPRLPTPPPAAFGRLQFGLKPDEPYYQGQSLACYYNTEKNISGQTFSTAQLLSGSTPVPVDYPPPQACAPVGFAVECNQTKRGQASCSVVGVPNSTVVCGRRQSEADCFAALSQHFPPNSAWVCGMSAPDSVTLYRNLSGFMLIVEGFLFTFSLFGIAGIFLSTLISPDPRNYVRCFGLFDI